MMFERADPKSSDQYLGSFYGLALPLVLRGIPVEPVQIESSGAPGFLSRYRLLLLTYEGQKPPTPAFHAALAAWVRAGGALVVVDNDNDPYNAVREWWNTAPNAFATPRQHLFAQLGIRRRRIRPVPRRQGRRSLGARFARSPQLPGRRRRYGARIRPPGGRCYSSQLERNQRAGSAPRTLRHRRPALTIRFPTPRPLRCTAASSISLTRICPCSRASRSRRERTMCSST